MIVIMIVLKFDKDNARVHFRSTILVKLSFEQPKIKTEEENGFYFVVKSIQTYDFPEVYSHKL